MSTVFAAPEDFEECARLHREYGTTYYFASRKLPEAVRRRVDAVYGFVRVPDEWVDNPGTMLRDEVAGSLACYRQQLLAASYGVRPDHAVLRAFMDVVAETGLPLDEAVVFLDAMEQDLVQSRYATYEDLRGYMRGSAAAVGVMLVYVLGADRSESNLRAAMALGEAMQITNFLRDVGEDLDRGRIYLPMADLEAFGLTETDVLERKLDDRMRAMLAMQIERARELFAASDAGIASLPSEVRFGIALARELYAKILTKIEENKYDVFSTRARTTPQEKMIAAWRLWSSVG